MKSNVTQQRVPVHGDPGHWVHVSESPRHVRVIFNGETIADSKRPKLLREAEVLPIYYFPQEDVRTDRLSPSQRRSQCPYKGEASYWSIGQSGNDAETAGWSYQDPLPAAAAIRNHFAFEWSKMDKWLEEDEEIFVHARDPYKRVDVLPSSRHIRILIDGQLIAETRRPRLVFETNHPVRYYIPQQDVRLDLLVSSTTKSRCPYKGPADYWSVKLGQEPLEDMVWGYMEPIPECPKIKGLLCFFHERGADIFVDGEEVPRPKTKWARELKKS
jgi:uncharacterized protein (DUF427 family)